MRSVILENNKTDVCGICGATQPLIEYKELEGIHFIWCKKCHTISFFKEMKTSVREQIEKEMNFYNR